MELTGNNATYAANLGTSPERPGPADLSHTPAGKLAVVTCMDCRLEPLAFLGLPLGEAHVIRNAGGVITEDVIRSLVLSQLELGTDTIVVIHHTECGMIGLVDDDFRAHIERETGVRPSFSMDGFKDPYAEARQSVARLQASPFLPHKDKIYAAVFNVATGRIEAVAAAGRHAATP